LIVWSLSNQESRLLAQAPPSEIAEAPVFHHAAFTSDGRSIVVGGVGGARVYNAGSGTLEHTLPGTNIADDVALSPDAKTLAASVLPPSCSEFVVTALAEQMEKGYLAADAVTLWRVADWRSERTLASVPSIELPVIAYSTDGSELAVGEADGS